MNADIYKCENQRYIFANVPTSGTTHYYNIGGRRKMVFDGQYTRVPVVCRCWKCEACRMVKQREWQSRISREMIQGNEKNYRTFFATVTLDGQYSDYFNCDPADASSKDGKYVYREIVHKRLFQGLRNKRGAGLKFRYFVVCEFGSDFNRLHFHIILIVSNPDAITSSKYYTDYGRVGAYMVRDNKSGVDRLQTPIETALHHLLVRYWSLAAKGAYPKERVEWYTTKQGHKASRLVFDNTLPLGNIEKVSECDCGSAQYVTKYVNKVTEDIAKHQEPFHRQSQGLGYQDVVSAIQDLDVNKCKSLEAFGRLEVNEKYSFKLTPYYRKKLRLFTFTYLKRNREFVRNAFGYARAALGIGIGIPFIDKDRRVFDLSGAETFDKIPYYPHGSATPLMLCTNDVHSMDRFVLEQFTKRIANIIWGYDPLKKRKVEDFSVELLY